MNSVELLKWGIVASITIISYLLIPVIVVLVGKRLPLKIIKLIAFTNTIVVHFIFYALADGNSSPYAFVIWGYAGYYLMKAKILNNDDVNKDTINSDTEIIQSSEECKIPDSSFTLDEEKAKLPKKKRTLKIPSKRTIFFTSIIVMLVTVLIITLYYANNEISDSYKRGYTNGENDGYGRGYDDGYESGLANGYDDGWSNGFQKASDELDIEDAYREGWISGYVNCMKEYEDYIPN